MKQIVKLAEARTPDGSTMALFQHDRDFSIRVNGQELMLSRQHESELALARLGCAHLTKSREPVVLIGGLGMGYTLRQTLDMLGSGASVIVSELLKPVTEWNRRFLGVLNNDPLKDPRVRLRVGDVFSLIAGSDRQLDALLLDVDNGPSALTAPANQRLYRREGILACQHALHKRGCLAVWSAEPSRSFERLLRSCGFQVRGFRVPVYKGSRATRYVWVASERESSLPVGDAFTVAGGRLRE